MLKEKIAKADPAGGVMCRGTTKIDGAGKKMNDVFNVLPIDANRISTTVCQTVNFASFIKFRIMWISCITQPKRR